jgi:hypothetical protein
MSLPVLFSMVPPLPAAPVPVTWRPPLEPVVSRMMPAAELFVPLPDEMLLKVTLPEPILVFSMSSAVPLVELIVLPAPVTVTVPPSVSLMPAPLPVLTLMSAMVSVPTVWLPSLMPMPLPAVVSTLSPSTVLFWPSVIAALPPLVMVIVGAVPAATRVCGLPPPVGVTTSASPAPINCWPSSRVIPVVPL